MSSEPGSHTVTGRGALPRENVFGHTKKLRLMIKSIEAHQRALGRPLRILDVGCGNGAAVSQFLAAGGDRYLGIDIHGPSIAYARTNFASDTLEFVVGGLEAIQQRDFDVVVLSDVLEHVDDPGALLHGAVARLAPGGLLLASVPNGCGPFELESALARLPGVGRALLTLLDYLVALLDRTLFLGRWRAVVPESQDRPYNADSGHVRFFGTEDIPALAAGQGLRLRGRENLSFLSGPFTNYLFAPWDTFLQWNVRVAGRLSSKIVSAWYFEFEKSHGAGVMARG